jgi:DNA-binding response OmpR family regulator
MRILLVEDLPDLRDVMAEFLREEGHSVAEAHDRDSALSALTAPAECDAIIVDVVLPGATGLEIAGFVQEAGTPVLLYTGHPASMSLLEAQGIRHLRKPFPLADIVTWLAEQPAGTATP